MESPIVTVVYSHGRFGSPWYGFKIEALRKIALSLGANVASVRYSEDWTVETMEERLLSVVRDDVTVPGDLVFLSSSRGAYLSTRIAGQVIRDYENEEDRWDDDKLLPRRRVRGQFLIAPAFYIKPDYYPDQDPRPPVDMPTTIVHGWDDKVIDCRNSIRFAEACGAQLHLVGGGHRLNSQRDLLGLLFENFLQTRMAESRRDFEGWLGEQGAMSPPPDDVAPGKAPRSD